MSDILKVRRRSRRRHRLSFKFKKFPQAIALIITHYPTCGLNRRLIACIPLKQTTRIINLVSLNRLKLLARKLIPWRDNGAAIVNVETRYSASLQG
jgi:hypothetical protein